MHRVHTSNLRPGMIVARSIYDSNHNVLLAAGVSLTTKQIARITTIGIGSVYIQDEPIDVEIPDVVLMETRSSTMQTLRANYTRLKNSYRLEMGPIIEKVEDVIGQCLKNRGTLVHLTDIRTYDEHTFAHSTNVCVLAVLAGISMGLGNDELLDLGIGALLHDVGKITLDAGLLNKPFSLTEEELAIVQEHALTGFTILSGQEDIPEVAACIAYQHHERWDGSGYPRQLKGEEIHPLARIVAVADIYEALLSDRPYRPSFSVSEALKTLNQLSGFHLERKSVRSLLVNIAAYPVGTVVILSSGERGVVVEINALCPTRPVVRVVYDAAGKRLRTPYALDLFQVREVHIAKTAYE